MKSGAIELAARAALSVLEAVLGTEWDVEDVAEALLELRTHPPSKADLSDLEEWLDELVTDDDGDMSL